MTSSAPEKHYREGTALIAMRRAWLARRISEFAGRQDVRGMSTETQMETVVGHRVSKRLRCDGLIAT